MLGPPKTRRLDQPISVSLDDLIPANHFYRHLETTLDLAFVRDWTHELYAPRGRPSIDPVVFFKLQLIMFFEGSRSERQIIVLSSFVKEMWSVARGRCTVAKSRRSRRSKSWALHSPDA